MGGGQSQYATIQMYPSQTPQVKPQLTKNVSGCLSFAQYVSPVSLQQGSRTKNSGSTMRASQQRRINSTLDNYKKAPNAATSRITQQTIEQAQNNNNYPMVQNSMKHQGPAKGRAGSNLRNNAINTLDTTGSKSNPRSKSNIKEAQRNNQPQMNNYLNDHHLTQVVQANMPNRAIQNQSPIYNQLQMANRFKAKRSESVITQRPPEISSSKNTLQNRGRNTSLPSNGPAGSKNTGPQSNKVTLNKFQSAVPFQYVQSSAGSNYDSQISMNQHANAIAPG